MKQGTEKKTRADYIMSLQAPFYSIDEAAKILGLSWRTIKRRIESGELKAAKIGQQYRISKEDLIAFIESTKI